MSLHSFGLAPVIFHYRPCGQLIVIAQLLKICRLGSTRVKGLTPGSEPVFMALPTKGFVMNREPQETKAFSKDKQLCSIHQHLHLLPPSLVKTNFLTEIIRGWRRTKHKKTFEAAKIRIETRRNECANIYVSTVAIITLTEVIKMLWLCVKPPFCCTRVQPSSSECHFEKRKAAFLLQTAPLRAFKVDLPRHLFFLSLFSLSLHLTLVKLYQQTNNQTGL